MKCGKARARRAASRAAPDTLAVMAAAPRAAHDVPRCRSPRLHHAARWPYRASPRPHRALQRPPCQSHPGAHIHGCEGQGLPSSPVLPGPRHCGLRIWGRPRSCPPRPAGLAGREPLRQARTGREARLDAAEKVAILEGNDLSGSSTTPTAGGPCSNSSSPIPVCASARRSASSGPTSTTTPASSASTAAWRAAEPRDDARGLKLRGAPNGAPLVRLLSATD